MQRALTPGRIIEIFGSGEEWLTRRQIAARLPKNPHTGRARSLSPTLITLIESCVQTGQLTRGEESLPNGQVCFWYRRITP